MNEQTSGVASIEFTTGPAPDGLTPELAAHILMRGAYLMLEKLEAEQVDTEFAATMLIGYITAAATIHMGVTIQGNPIRFPEAYSEWLTLQMTRAMDVSQALEEEIINRREGEK